MKLDIKNPLHCIDVCRFLHDVEDAHSKDMTDDEREALTLTCITLSKLYTNNLVSK